MFRFIKLLFELRRSIKELKQRDQAYQSMAPDELMTLPDVELFNAVFARTIAKVNKYTDTVAGVNALHGAEKAFYVASYFEMEVNNGGLCQFFVNSSREVAPQLADALSEIGAVRHRELFESFVEKNAINIHDLSSFVIDSIDEYGTQAKRYPFDDFDNAFYSLPPIQELLVPYIREHISEF